MFSVLALVVAGGMDASADDPHPEFRWLAATGQSEIGDLCVPMDPPCPDGAIASSNGGTIEMTGEGKLSIEALDDPEPRGVSGGGSYIHRDSTGAIVDIGTWTAEELLSFVRFGGLLGPLGTLQAGNALMEVRLVSDLTGDESDGIFELGCRILGDEPTIEGVRIDVEGVANFDISFDDVGDPRSTLFIRIGSALEDEEDDSDSDSDDSDDD